MSREKTDPTALTTQQILREISVLKELVETKFVSVEIRQDASDKAAALFQSDLVRVPTAVDKAVAGLKDLLFSEIEKTKAISVERLARIDTLFGAHSVAIDAALKSEQKAAADAAMILRSENEKLAAVSIERFARIDTMFVEIEKRTNQLSVADKTAVAAALQAAKEAVGAQNTSNSVAIAKSESSTVESIKQLQALFNTANDANIDKINDLKSRLDRGEGKTSVSDPAVADGIRQLGVMIADLAKSRDTNTGHSSGMGAMWGIVLGGAGFAMAFVTFFLLVMKTAA